MGKLSSVKREKLNFEIIKVETFLVVLTFVM